MLRTPFTDPVALHVGPLAVHWYGLMYIAGFVAFLALGKYRARTQPHSGFQAQDVDDLLTWGVVGVIIGGRLGQVLFYEPAYYFAAPWEIIAIWKGGMSFHGGLLGVILALYIWARRQGKTFLEVSDFIVPLTPPGLFFGRLGNYINGELWGRLASPDLPWAVIFTRADPWPRHPSPLYEALGEGLLLFVLVWLFSRKPRRVGVVSGFFLTAYALARFCAEYFREPDAGIFGHSYLVSMGQWLSLPMLAAGLYLMFFWRRP